MNHGATNALLGKLFVGGRFVSGRLEFAHGRIVEIQLGELGVANPDLPLVAPGFVDLHIHGFGGFDPLDDLAGMARALARAGTTAFQPTLFPGEPTKLGADCERVWSAASSANAGVMRGARVVGLHLEGPFVNPERAGALPPGDLATPSVEGLRAILGPASGAGRGVRTMTLACELAGGPELVRELVRSNVRVSLGHSQATAAEARAAARAGANGATHLFNAMGPVHHREIGLAGFALSKDALFAEIIGDLVHVGADAFELALAARGPAGLCLVSDALQGAGTGCERFESHGRSHVIDCGTAYYPSHAAHGERKLAGSAMSQLEMVQRLVARGVCSIEDALTMAATTPARALGLERKLGALAVGARADVLVLDPRTLELRDVFVGGESLLR
ncbi:MAG: N-acetylglucosamine-6-phosphate deacetylase [Planctomycetes bacterium]|nr:N-acetylglucosamine-6-phosphate deacetylase [Planctomycetota bacterium]